MEGDSIFGLVGLFVRDKSYSERWPDGIHALGIVTCDQGEGWVFVRGLGYEGCGTAGVSRRVDDLEVVPDSEAFAWVLRNRETGHREIRDALNAVLDGERRPE